MHAPASHTTSASSLFTQTNWNTISDLAYKLNKAVETVPFCVYAMMVLARKKMVRFNKEVIAVALGWGSIVSGWVDFLFV